MRNTQFYLPGKRPMSWMKPFPHDLIHQTDGESRRFLRVCLIQNSRDDVYGKSRYKVLSIKSYIIVYWFKRNNNRQTLGNVSRYDLGQEINRKSLSALPNVPTNFHLKYKPEGGPSFLHGQVVHPRPKHRKENQLLSLEHTCWWSPV